MADETKPTVGDTGTNAGATGAASGETPTVETPFVVNSVQTLTTAVNTAAAPVEKSTKMYNKTGFKGLEGLADITNERLAVMAGACMRQIALNGGTNVVALLGAERKPGIIAQFGIAIQNEAEQERKISAYEVVAADCGIKRGAGESASDFIGRVKAARAK